MEPIKQEQYTHVKDGNKYYYKDIAMTILHRIDGPAIEYADGDKSWWVDGKMHQLDGPAVEYANGYKAWWVDGKRHRLGGPAIEWTNGDKEWWVDGKYLTEEQFNALAYTIL